jgi:hypothetical protein
MLLNRLKALGQVSRLDPVAAETISWILLLLACKIWLSKYPVYTLLIQFVSLMAITEAVDPML